MRPRSRRRENSPWRFSLRFRVAVSRASQLARSYDVRSTLRHLRAEPLRRRRVDLFFVPYGKLLVKLEGNKTVAATVFWLETTTFSICVATIFTAHAARNR